MADPAPYLVDRADGVLTLSFNRAEQGNSIPQDVVPALTELFSSINTDPTVRVLLVRGEGAHFSAGGDVRSFHRALDMSVADRRADFTQRLDTLRLMVEAYLAIEVPVVAACQGAVAGAGLMFALGADYVVGDETVAFLFSHQRIGLPPDGGVSVLLPRVVGHRHAAELVLTAAKVEAAEALRLGLVSAVVAPAELAGQSQAQARRFSRAPVGALKGAKALLAASGTQSSTAQLLAERDAIVQAVGEPDFEEGVRAFVEKRKAVFPSTVPDS